MPSYLQSDRELIDGWAARFLVDRQNGNRSQNTRANALRQATNNDGDSIKALPDGRIDFNGTIIGPFLGEYQGVPRNQIIAERLQNVQPSDLSSTRIDPDGAGVKIYLGDTFFSLLSGDIRAINGDSRMTGYDVAASLLRSIGAKVPEKSLAQLRGELAIKQARINYLEGKALYGNGSWETYGSNQGPLLGPINQSNHASTSSAYEWCGMFVGHAYKKAGIRPEILRSLVFWSGHRLHLFFTRGVDVSNRPVGSFWQPHKYLELSSNANQRKAQLDSFAPRAGDVALFKSDYSHVGIVDSYNPQTGELEILEGNSGNRVRATVYGSGERQITFIGRFNNSDFGSEVDPSLLQRETPNVSHTDRKSNQTQ